MHIENGLNVWDDTKGFKIIQMELKRLNAAQYFQNVLKKS